METTNVKLERPMDDFSRREVHRAMSEAAAHMDKAREHRHEPFYRDMYIGIAKGWLDYAWSTQHA